MRAALILALALPGAAAATPEFSVPISVHVPSGARAQRWPVTTGVPFAPGALAGDRALALVDGAGREVPAQIARTATWEDGSWRWALADFTARAGESYALVARAPSSGPPPGAIAVERRDAELIVTAGRARYVFRGGLDEVSIAGRPIARGGVFALETSDGERSTIQAAAATVELEGPLRTVVRVSGAYRNTRGEHVASASVDYHFFAGSEVVKLSHELVLDRSLEKRAIRDLGLSLPLAFAGTTAGANLRPGDPRAAREVPATAPLVLVQDEVAHFGRRRDHFRLLHGGRVLETGAIAGDFAYVSSPGAGIAVQMPAFAEQFPAALRASSSRLEVSFWAAEGGRALDLTTPALVRDVLGHDWIPADHDCAKRPNVPEGMARTHEVWLYAFDRAITAADRDGFAATRDELYAAADPAHVAASGVFGPIHPHDPRRFPEMEATISAWFDRNVSAGGREFPATGFLFWGLHPYGAQPWEEKEGRWYPTLHRLGRGLDYGLKRGVWILYARSGERRYREYARRYTRFLRDVTFSHADAPLKPKGWIVLGSFHCPIVWGQFSAGGIDKARRRGRTPGIASEVSALGFASSEDVIQLAWDYFLTGDLRSRDMARAYARALIDGTGGHADRILAAAGKRPDAFLRMIGSAYALEHDPALRALGSSLLRALVGPDGAPNPAHPPQWGKWGEVYSAYLHYWVSVRDPLARKALVHLADTLYRRGDVDAYFDRSSPLLQAASFAAEDLRAPIHLAYVARGVEGLIERVRTRRRSTPWGQEVLTWQGMITGGLPAAAAALARHGAPLPPVPFARQPEATAKVVVVLEKARGAARLDVFVEDPGARGVEPRLLDRRGRAAALRVVERSSHRIGPEELAKPAGLSPWLGRSGTQSFYRLELPAGAGAYTLDLGDAVAFTVLDAGVDRIALWAPHGLALHPGALGFFSAGAEPVSFFASGAVTIARDGTPVRLEALGEGRYRFAAAPGTYALAREERLPVFVRREDGPLLLAFGDPARLPAAPAIAPRVEASGPGRFGGGAHLAQRFVEAVPERPLPRAEGTVELWMRPAWSSTDVPIEDALSRVQLYAAAPLSISYAIDPDPNRSGGFQQAGFVVQLEGVGSLRALEHLQAGRWYHLAVTWKIDGKDNDLALFIDGRRRTDVSSKARRRAKATPEKIAAPAAKVRFGSAHVRSALRGGETFDELRVSDVARYRDDFTPQPRPFAPDRHTVLLLHLDNAPATVAGKRLH